MASHAESDPRSEGAAEAEPSSAGGLTWNLVSAVLPLVGSLLVSLLLAPYLGDHAWGEYSLVLSAATLLLIVAKFGVHSATSRLVTDHEEEAGTWLRAGLALRTIFTVGTAAMAILGAPLLARSFGASAEAFWFVAPVLVAASYYEFGGEVLVGLRRYRALLLTRLAYLGLRLAAIAVVRIGALGVVAFLAGHSTAQVLPAVVTIALLWRSLPVASTTKRRDAVLRTWQLSLPLAFSSASYLVFAHTDRLMLGWFRDPSVVGQFAVARNVLDAAIFPLTALAWSLRPALSRALRGRSGADPASALAEGSRLAVLYAISAPALLLVFGPGLVVGLFTPIYAEAAELLVWMLPLLFLRGLGSTIFPALLAADAQISYARLMVWTAVLNVGANSVLIPAFGARGAIVGTLLSLLLLTGGGLTQLRHRFGTLGIGAHLGSHLRAAVSSVIVAGASWWLLPTDPSLTVLAAGAVVATALVLGLNLRGLRLR